MDGSIAEFTLENGPVADVPRYTLYPEIEVVVLAFHDRLTMCWMVAPAPLAVSAVEPELVVKKAMFAEAVPAVVGAKVTVKGTLWPDARVTGRVSPPSVNSELLELVDDKTTLPPLAVTVPFWVWADPTVTLPKLIEPGVTPSVPLELVPLPVRDTPTDGSDALEASESVPFEVPAIEGEKITERFALAPGAKSYGKFKPLKVYPVPLTLAPEMVSIDPPVFETVTGFVWLLPTGTLPRFMLEGAVKYPGFVVLCPFPERIDEAV
jgi:hypothetical protein